MQVQRFLGEEVEFLPLEICWFLVPIIQPTVTFTHHVQLIWKERRLVCCYSQFYDNGTWFDFIHFHKSETFSAGESLLGFVVLEFKENSCSYRKETRGE